MHRFNQNQFGIIILIIIYIIINIIHIKVEQHEFYEVLLNEMGFYLRKVQRKTGEKVFEVWDKLSRTNHLEKGTKKNIKL